MISTMLDELLAAAVAAVPPVDLPERQFVAHGDFAHDCAQLAVRLAGYELIAQTDDGGCAVIPSATFEVQLLLDCWPTAKADKPFPDAADISTAARRAADAGVAMLDGIHDASADGSLFSERCCDDVNISDLDAVGPEAGIVGWALTVSVRL